MERRQRRAAMAVAWALVVIAWCTAAVFALGLTSLVPCGGDGGSPYAAPDSPAGRYCGAIEDYYESGEPGEGTTALVYLSPIALLLTLGAIAVWRRSSKLLAAFALLAFAALGVHVVLAFSLPNRCSPDDRSVSGCQHY